MESSEDVDVLKHSVWRTGAREYAGLRRLLTFDGGIRRAGDGEATTFFWILGHNEYHEAISYPGSKRCAELLSGPLGPSASSSGLDIKYG